MVADDPGFSANKIAEIIQLDARDKYGSGKNDGAADGCSYSTCYRIAKAAKKNPAKRFQDVFPKPNSDD